MEYNSQLGNFNEDQKNGKRQSSKYILSSSGSNLISVKRRNRACQCFEARLAGTFSGDLFRNGPSGLLQSYIIFSSSLPWRSCSCFEILGK
jgi:hexokinase